MKRLCVGIFFFIFCTQFLSVAQTPVVQEVGPQLQQIIAIRRAVEVMAAHMGSMDQALQNINQMEQETHNISFQLLKMNSLVQHGELLTGAEAQKAMSTMSITSPPHFNPDTQQFEDGGFDFVGNIWVSSDDMLDTVVVPPRKIVPISDPSIIRQIKSDWLQRIEEPEGKAVMLGYLDPLSAFWSIDQRLTWKQQLYSRFYQADLIPTQTPNVIMRPYELLDSYYMGLPKVEFYLLNGASHYNPCTGSGSVNDGPVYLDLNNTVSSGYSQAIDQYNRRNPGSAKLNPYKSYANLVVPGLRQMVLNQELQIGEVPSDAQLKRALEIAPSLKQDMLDRVAAVKLLYPYNSQSKVLDASQPAESSEYVFSIGLHPEDEDRFIRRTTMSQERLREITMQLNIETTLLGYTKDLMTSLTNILHESQALASQLTQQNAIPELSLLIQGTQQDLETQQRNVSDILRAMDNLHSSRHKEIVDLMDFVHQARDQIQSMSDGGVISSAYYYNSKH